MWRVVCVLLVCWSVGAIKEDKHYWATLARSELDATLKVKLNKGLAKNVILFVGDGMGLSTVTAARLYKGNGNETTKLTFEEFPHTGLLKTYCIDKQVPDSASTATALFCGVKANYRTTGVDSNVQRNDCKASLNPSYWVKSILHWAQESGKDTGFVTTSRVTHATPSALYAHSPERGWECEATMPPEASNCKDIARQMIEDEPGRNIKVIMGGGRQCLVHNATGTRRDPIDTWACLRDDGRDLIQVWQDDKRARNFVPQVLSNTKELDNLDIENTDYVLGIFANGHFPYAHDRDQSPTGMPSLEKMTSSAIRILQKNTKGYVLMIEGGMIDVAHHRGLAQHALYETVALDAAVRTAVASTAGYSDTLIIVTSDHSHSLSISGYAARGSSIVGLAGKSKIDNIPYTTLSYATGDKHGFKHYAGENGKVLRTNPLKENYTSFDYHQQAAILTDEATHGGEDIAIYATGPMAHLFHSTHEQNYVAHVIGYAAKIGPYTDEHAQSKASWPSINLFIYIIAVIILL